MRSRVQNNRSPWGTEDIIWKGLERAALGFLLAVVLLKSDLGCAESRSIRTGRASKYRDYYGFSPNYHPKYECKLPSSVPGGYVRMYIYYMSQLPLDVSLGLLISSVRGWVWQRVASYSRGGLRRRSSRRRGVSASVTPRKNVANKACRAGTAGIWSQIFRALLLRRIAPFPSRSRSLRDSGVGLPESHSPMKTSRTPAAKIFPS